MSPLSPASTLHILIDIILFYTQEVILSCYLYLKNFHHPNPLLPQLMELDLYTSVLNTHKNVLFCLESQSLYTIQNYCLIPCSFQESFSISLPYYRKRSIWWLKTVSLYFNTYSLMDRYYHTFLFVSLKMVSNKCPIIGQQVEIIFPTLMVTIATQ